MAAAGPRVLGTRAVWILFIVLCQSRRSHGGFVVVPNAPSKICYQRCSTAIHKNIRKDNKSWRLSPSCQEPQPHCKPTSTSIFITSRGPAAFPQRRKHLLAKTKEEDDSSNKEDEKGGVFRSLNFWSNKDSDDSPKAEQEQEPKGQGIFRFFNRGSNDDDNEKEEEEGDDGNKKKRKKQKSTSNKNDDSADAEDDDQGEGGFLKSITKRVFGKDKDENPETIEEQSLDLIDTRPTFITFQRSSPQPSRVPPKEGTKSMPIISTPSVTPSPPRKTKSVPPNKQTASATSLRSTTTGSSTTSSSASKQQPSKSIAPPQQPNLKAKGKGDDDKSSGKAKSKSESTDEESGSMMDKFLRFFGNNTSVDDDTAGASGKNKTSGSPRSVASKFFSNLLESRTANKEQWVPVCPKTRLSPGEIVPVEVAGLDLIVVASKDAQNIYCMVNSCPHLGTPLETGSLERRPIEVNKDEATTPPIPGTFRKQPLQIQESDVAAMLANDGCEDCIVCPLHKTAFALKSGQVRGEWCPYPPVLGKMLASVKQANSAAVFDVRTRGKNIEVRLNTPLQEVDSGDAKDK